MLQNGRRDALVVGRLGPEIRDVGRSSHQDVVHDAHPKRDDRILRNHGDALGQLYVQQYFSAATKERYTRLTGEIFDAFGERIRRLGWMTPPTKARALRKLDAVAKKVGYPERWKDYSAYRVERGPDGTVVETRVEPRRLR